MNNDKQQTDSPPGGPPRPPSSAASPRGSAVARTPRAVRVLAGAAVMGITLVVSLVVADVAIRVQDARAGRDAEFYLPANATALEAGMYAPHPYLGFVLRPGFEREGKDDGKWQISINSLGMRGPELAPKKPEDGLRILCLGGSTTFCTGATRDSRTWPSRLQEFLARRIKGPVEVGNCGVPGYSSAESLINLELRLVDLDPDLVLFYHAPNDGRMMQTVGFKSDYSHVRRSWAPERLSPQETWLVRNWRLYARLARGMHPAEHGATLDQLLYVEKFMQFHVRSDERIVEPGLVAYERNLESFIAVALAHDTLPVLQTFAICKQRPSYGNSHYLELIPRQNTIIRDLGERLGVPVLDIAPQLENRPPIFDDWMHYNDNGCVVHARAVVQALAAKGLLSPAGRKRWRALGRLAATRKE